MDPFVSIRLYTLKPDADPKAFEAAFHRAHVARGLKRILLLKGYRSNNPKGAQSTYDYASIHFYANLDASQATSTALHAAMNGGDIPDDLADLIDFWRVAHTDTLAESVVNGFFQIHEAT